MDGCDLGACLLGGFGYDVVHIGSGCCGLRGTEECLKIKEHDKCYS